MPTQAFFEGKFVPIEQAKVSVMTHALNYGTGVFEGIRGYWNADQDQLYVFRLREHYERMLRSLKVMQISIPYGPEELCELTIELLRRECYHEDVYIRPLAYKSDEVIGVRLHNLHDQLTMFATPFGRYIDKEEGARVCVSSWRRNDDNAIPARAKITGSYVNSALIKSEAVLSGFDEAIALNHDGHVSEGSAENLFLVSDGRLITPSVTENILEGITRDTIMRLAQAEFGLPVVERPIDRSELYTVDEAFLCGTGCQVAAIASIDNRPVGAGSIGPVTMQLRDLYFRVVRGEEPKYIGWCTPVYNRNQ